MPVPEDERLAHRLTRRQKRLLLWMPIVGVWLVLWVIARTPEGDRDWPTFLALGLVASLVLAGLWLVTVRIIESKARDQRSTAEKVAQKGSRAALIYGDSAGTGSPDAGAEQSDAVADGSEETPDEPREGD